MTKQRMTHRDVFLKTLGVAFKSAPCGCDPYAPAAEQPPDPAELRQLLADFHRRECLVAALREPNGPLALDVVEKATRWLTNGRLTNGKQQEPPMVKFMDFDGKRNGCYKPLDPYSVYLSRGLSDEELVRCAAHEVSHFLRPWDSREEIPRIEAQIVFDQYFRSFERLA